MLKIDSSEMRYLCNSVLVVCFVCVLVSFVNAQTLRTVAITGDAAPGGSEYDDFGIPVLNSIGQSAFTASLDSFVLDTGIWSESSGSLAEVAREGEHAPGTPNGVSFGEFDLDTIPRLSTAGLTVFNTVLTGNGIGFGNSTGIWSENLGSLTSVVHGGIQAPGTTSGVTFTTFFDDFLLNSSGQTAFRGFLAGTGVNSSNDTGIWSEGAGSLALLAREGSQASGAPNGVVYSDFNETAFLVLNSNGQIAFRGNMTGTGVENSNDGGIWLGGSGSLALIAREGDQASGVPSGVNYGTLRAPALNSAGQIAFSGFLTGIGVDSTNDRVIWSGSSDSLALVAREGDQASGVPSGVNFTGLGAPVLNSAGQTAFDGTLSGNGVGFGNNSGFWSEGSGSLNLVAREGDQAPGTASGVFFDSFTSNTFGFALNSVGQTAFIADLAGDVDFSNDRGIWAEDQEGSLQLIVREGNQLQVGPGDFRTILELGFNDIDLGFRVNTGNDDGRPSGFNDFGQLAFWARVSGSTEGIFVSSLVATNTFSADFDEDGDVDAADLAQWEGDFGLNAKSDSDLDGDSDGADFLAWQRQFEGGLSTISSSLTVPEPSAFLLSLIGFIAACFKHSQA